MERDGVPVIDMMKNGDELAEQLVKACEEWVCFRMVNHGVPSELMAEMNTVVASLLDLPQDIKKRTTNPEQGKGYIGRNPTTPFLESLSIDEVSFPDEFCDRLDASPHQREVICKYTKAVRDLAGLLGRKLMEGSGLTGDLFEGWCCQLRMNKYHYSPETVGLPGACLHTDPTFLTILQDDENVNGLQVVDKCSGDFVPLDPVPGTLAFNIGDIGKDIRTGKIIGRGTEKNGLYYVDEVTQNGTVMLAHGTVGREAWLWHRRLGHPSTAKTRYSIALFVLGPNEKKVEAPLKLVDLEHPRLYVPIDAGELRRVRISTGLRTGGALEFFRTTTP